MTEIDRVHDKFFKKTFEDPSNARTFLEFALPGPLRDAIDFSDLEIDATNYVSNQFQEYFSDIVIKTCLKSQDEDELLADVYILFEHKCYRDTAIFVQLLRYMYMMWQKDIDENRPLRVIIPVVFYHGKEKWNIPRSFAGQFKVNDAIKKFLLDYKYVLFDTAQWDFQGEVDENLKDNVFLLTALAFMKSTSNKDIDSIRGIFKFWYEKGFIKEKEKMLFFLMYLSETKDIPPERLEKILEESKIEGGDIMPTLAQRLRDEGKEKWMQKGLKEGKLETAQRMLSDKFPVETIVKYTGLTEKEIKALMN
jgi:predicted transposase/invertase (TIGR01784 family)